MFCLLLIPNRKKYSAQESEFSSCLSAVCPLPLSPFHCLVPDCRFLLRIPMHLYWISARALEVGRVAIASGDYHKNDAFTTWAARYTMFARVRYLQSTNLATKAASRRQLCGHFLDPETQKRLKKGGKNITEHAARIAPILRRCDGVAQRLLRHAIQKMYRK